MSRARTFGELKASGYRPRPVKEEIRANLLRRLRAAEAVFPGIHGYEDSVFPGIMNALLARHDFILLGLRGQAKTRILRDLTSLLDDEIPVLEGSEVNDDPFQPISKYGRERLETEGDEAAIAWLPREARYVEKLATPDVTIADIIGDLDPIRAARGGHLLSDELSMHYGLLPRANRGIFAVNELPDLTGKIQVGLFNVMQEGDVQIKGFPVRLPLDVLLVFTANPEDYTARGKIVTPLRDRIGSEILTHYPRTVEEGVTITRQEAWTDRGTDVRVPEFVRGLAERVAFAARDDKRVDQRSGVSQRMPIAIMEGAVSNAERRAAGVDQWPVTVRPLDIHAALPAMTGKLELEYEGELQGADTVAIDLIAAAAEEEFDAWFETEDAEPIVEHFERGGVLQVSDGAREAALLEGFRGVTGLLPLVEHSGLAPEGVPPGDVVAACELVLEGLAAKRKITRTETGVYRRAGRGRRGPGESGGSTGFGGPGGPGQGGLGGAGGPGGPGGWQGPGGKGGPGKKHGPGDLPDGTMLA